MLNSSKCLGIVLVLFTAPLVGVGQTVTEDFTSAVSGNGFALFSDINVAPEGVTFDTSGGGSMTVNMNKQANGTGEQPFAAMSRQFANNAAKDWSMSANLNVAGLASANAAAGLAAMSSASDFGGEYWAGTGYKALVKVDFNSSMDLIFLGGNSEILTASENDFAAVPAADRTLNFSGTYNGSGDLTLTASLFDGLTLIQSISHTVLAVDVLTGDYFGTYVAKRWGGNPANVIYNSAEISVIPEPSSTVFLSALSAMGVILCRRRR